MTSKGIIFCSEKLSCSFTLDGPRKYSTEYLIECARDCIFNEYPSIFDEIECDIDTIVISEN